MARKVRQKKFEIKFTAGKLWQKNHGRKNAAKKPQQKKCSRKITTEKLWQKIRSCKTVAIEHYKKKKGMVFICVVFNL
jgi:hypothetical protein